MPFLFLVFLALGYNRDVNAPIETDKNPNNDQAPIDLSSSLSLSLSLSLLFLGTHPMRKEKKSKGERHMSNPTFITVEEATGRDCRGMREKIWLFYGGLAPFSPSSPFYTTCQSQFPTIEYHFVIGIRYHRTLHTIFHVENRHCNKTVIMTGCSFPSSLF